MGHGLKSSYTSKKMGSKMLSNKKKSDVNLHITTDDNDHSVIELKDMSNK